MKRSVIQESPDSTVFHPGYGSRLPCDQSTTSQRRTPVSSLELV